MSLASTTFLFLFLPAAVGIYFLIPRQKNLLFRNVFLFVFSLFFYVWGEPVFILPLLAMIVLTWLFGKMANGRGYTTVGNIAVTLTVLMNLSVLLAFKDMYQLLQALGLLLGKDLLIYRMTLPMGLSFFGFHSISYVVDIYRGQAKPAKNFLYAGLYLSAFFKILQGPTVTYHEFEPQIENRTTTPEKFSHGIWRIAIGLGKKMIVATNLVSMGQFIFSSDLASLSMSDAWIGCLVYMIFIYFDFSGYSDMAIGTGEIFGFKIPENFNYPYISTSIGEYWRRWHITLCAWFRDYLYFPILLGPSVRFRKFLLRHNADSGVAKVMQEIFVPSFIWLITALWHGTNWNFTVWGLVNSSAMIVEPHVKPIGNRKVNTVVRWLLTMLIIILTKPFVCTATFSQAMLYFKAMFAGTGVYAVSHPVQYFLKVEWIILLIGIIGCFPVLPWLKKRLYSTAQPRTQIVRQLGEAVLLMLIVILSLAFLFRTGCVTFMYQQL